MSITRNLPQNIIVMSADVIPHAKQLASEFNIKASLKRHIQKFTNFATDNISYPVIDSSPNAAYVFVGNTTQSKFGNYLPEEFVDKFKNSLKGAELGQIYDIYLIGNEMGLPDEQGELLAQKIANEFVKQGFSTALHVHAITAPESNKDAAVYTEVVMYEGDNINGKLNAFVFTAPQQKQRYAELTHLAITAGLTEAENNEIKQLRANANTFLFEADPLIELCKEYNIYHPHESVSDRYNRIITDFNEESIAAAERLIAIDLMKEQRNYLQTIKDHKTIDLNTLIDLIENKYFINCRNYAMAWRGTIKKYKDTFKKDGADVNSTYTLLNHLASGDIEQAKKIVKQSPITDSQKNVNDTLKTSEITKAILETRDSKRSIDKKKLFASSPPTFAVNKEEPRTEMNISLSAPARSNEAVSAKDQNLAYAEIYLHYLKMKYAKELKGIQLFTNIKGTKAHKYRAADKLLSVIAKGGTFDDLSNEVGKILITSDYRDADKNNDIDPKKVMYSYCSTYTADIINAIRSRDAEKLRVLAEAVSGLTAQLKS